ncbi:Crp/Fnr family transcriptional regulator [Desulfovermiculus halophilus]|jgi:CRP-like cAMP-binding protein|uniref:Crp/Fnr family transcriptional regulator n=1 Tax=Desulfovermiculus halophilus TaxID=339722 RepID=UPI0004858355|nr:Crp/Fnr family transcriptional regulator [Desulfovermiculus halophilus]
MVDKHELRRITLIQDMSDAHLELLGSVGKLKIFSDDTVLFSEGQELDQCYMVLTGSIFLEVQPVPDVIITLERLEPGACFGLSSLVGGSRSQSSAVCAESCELVCLPGQKLLELMESHHDFGFSFLSRIVHTFRNRMEHRTQLFLRALQNHPELQHLFISGSEGQTHS